MGVLYDIFERVKKRCTNCGCHFYDGDGSDICCMCLDEFSEDTWEPEEVLNECD